MTLRDKFNKGLCDDISSREGHESGLSDYEQSDGDIYLYQNDEESENIMKKIMRLVYDLRCDNIIPETCDWDEI